MFYSCQTVFPFVLILFMKHNYCAPLNFLRAEKVTIFQAVFEIYYIALLK